MAVLVSLTMAVLGAPAAVPCGYEDCASYCSGACPYRPNISSATVEAMKVWRITPWNVTRLADHDVGDAAGDMGFLLNKYMQNSECTPPYVTTECFLDDLPIVAEFAVEFDAAYGPYLKCNPVPIPGSHGLVDTGDFLCAYGHPGYNPWAPTSASCPAPCNRANVSVGKDPAHHVWNGTKQSADSISSYFGGYWYSATKAGECKPGNAPGDGSGCTWRETGPARYVNASCLADQLFGVLKAKNPSCFAACGSGAGRGNRCFGSCVTATVLGQPAGAGNGVEISTMVAAWEAAFDKCPHIPPADLDDPSLYTAHGRALPAGARAEM